MIFHTRGKHMVKEECSNFTDISALEALDPRAGTLPCASPFESQVEIWQDAEQVNELAT